MDRLSKKQRSSLMAKVRIKDTDIEKLLGEIVKSFWKKERYRKNVKSLPGKPDIVFPESKIAIFADGDFWHGKDFKKWKSEIPVFWRKKIAGNILRDRLQDKTLRKAGYRVLRFFGSKIKRNSQLVHNAIRRSLE
mgnify:FL=1